METNTIEARKNHTFAFRLENDNRSFSVFIPFQPDEFILKSVLYYSTVNEGAIDISFVYADWTKDNSTAICSFYDPVCYTPSSQFLVRTPLPNVLNFQIQAIDGSIVANRAGRLVLTGEFVKYKSVKSEKIY